MSEGRPAVQRLRRAKLDERTCDFCRERHGQPRRTQNDYLQCTSVDGCRCVLVEEPEPQGKQPAPEPNDLPAVWEAVIADMKARDEYGRGHYGTPLQPFNGRYATRDAYEEALDTAVYLKQKSIEETAIRTAAEGVLERHSQNGTCVYDGDVWPCDAARLAGLVLGRQL